MCRITTIISRRHTSPHPIPIIEKDAAINDEIDRMRHSATAWLSRKARCNHRRVGQLHLRSMGDPEEYAGMSVSLREGMQIDRDELLRRLVEIQYDAQRL